MVIRKIMLMTMCLFLTAAIPVVKAAPFNLEGFLYDENNPDETVVVIDGQFLKRGDQYKGYLIEEVTADSVTVRKVGSEKVVELKMDDSSEQLAEMEAEAKAVQPEPSPPASPWEEFMKTVQSWFGG